MTSGGLFASNGKPEGSVNKGLDNERGSQSRIVALIDMDCFYVQVEQKLAPEWKGKPCAVVQYNEWKGGGIIAVGYEARARGVTRRGMRGEEARIACPEIKLFKVPEVRGKADLTRYREAGAEVISALSQFEKCRVERASVDEAYIDLTEEVQDMMSRRAPVTCDDLLNTYIVGTNDEEREASVRDWLEFIFSSDCLDSYNDQRLAYGAQIVERMRKAVKDQTGFSCSGGISHNKVLSKLACGLHKPQKQTILSMGSVPDLFATLPVRKVRHFGGKLGQRILDDFGAQYMGDICKIPKKELCSQYGEKTGNFVYALCRGHDPEIVSSRQLPLSVGCSKNFMGKLAIANYVKARYWLKQLSTELEERLVKDREQNNRLAKGLSLSVRFTDYQNVTRALPISRYSQAVIENSAMSALIKLCGEGIADIKPAINSLGLNAGKFEDIDGKSLTNYFQAGTKSSVDLFSEVSPPKKAKTISATMSEYSLKSFMSNSGSTKSSVSLFDTVSPPKKAKSVPATNSEYNLKSFMSIGSTAVDPFSSTRESTTLDRKAKKPSHGLERFFNSNNSTLDEMPSKLPSAVTSVPFSGLNHGVCSEMLYHPELVDINCDILDLDYDSDSSTGIENVRSTQPQAEVLESQFIREDMTLTGSVVLNPEYEVSESPENCNTKAESHVPQATNNIKVGDELLDELIAIFDDDSSTPEHSESGTHMRGNPSTVCKPLTSAERARSSAASASTTQEGTACDEESDDSVSFFDVIELEQTLHSQQPQSSNNSNAAGLAKYINQNRHSWRRQHQKQVQKAEKVQSVQKVINVGKPPEALGAHGASRTSRVRQVREPRQSRFKRHKFRYDKREGTDIRPFSKVEAENEDCLVVSTDSNLSKQQNDLASKSPQICCMSSIENIPKQFSSEREPNNASPNVVGDDVMHLKVESECLQKQAFMDRQFPKIGEIQDITLEITHDDEKTTLRNEKISLINTEAASNNDDHKHFQRTPNHHRSCTDEWSVSIGGQAAPINVGTAPSSVKIATAGQTTSDNEKMTLSSVLDISSSTVSENFSNSKLSQLTSPSITSQMSSQATVECEEGSSTDDDLDISIVWESERKETAAKSSQLFSTYGSGKTKRPVKSLSAAKRKTSEGKTISTSTKMPADTELCLTASAAVGLLITAGFVLYRYRASSSVRRSVCKISQIRIYPIFSASALLMKSADCTESGLQYKSIHNRQFELVGGSQYSPVNSPKIRKIRLAYDEMEDTLVVRGPGMARELRILLPMPKYQILDIQSISWLNGGKTFYVEDVKEHCDWFSEYLGHQCRLVRLVPREVVQKLYLDVRNKTLNPIELPFNIKNLASIDYINARLETPISEETFCGNIFIASKEHNFPLYAYEEDAWSWIQMGNEVVLYNSEACHPLPGLDWSELSFSITSLIALVKCMLGSAKIEMRKANFGVDASLVSPGRISVGDTVVGICVSKT